MNGWVQLIGSAGFAAVLTAIIAAVAGNRTQKANAGNITIQSADTQITNLEGERDYWQGQTDQERKRANKEAMRNRDWWARADRMMVWVRRQEQRNNDNGIHDPAPQLIPDPDGE